MIPRDVQEERTREYLPLVEKLADRLIARNKARAPFRDDMIGAGNAALWDWAGRYEGDRFGSSVRIQLLNTMRHEVRERIGRAPRRRADEPWEPRDTVSMDAPFSNGEHESGLPEDGPHTLHDVIGAEEGWYGENAVLGRIDRRRAMDGRWEERERGLHVPGGVPDPHQWEAIKGRLSENERRIFDLRRRDGLSLRDTMWRTGLEAEKILRLERQAMGKLSGLA